MNKKIQLDDTIAAIGTAVSNNAISIIKVSGMDAIDITNKIFSKDLKKVNSHTITYGYILENNNKVDEVLVSVFKAPKSFTCEDVVEINCHGGVFVTNKILRLLLENGARLAEAGEFTKRAFLNGRIDLTEAESIMDVIECDTNQSLALAANGLFGKTKELIKAYREKVLKCLLAIEVNIDYPEYEDEEQISEYELFPKLKELINDIDVVLSKSEVSQILKNGIDTAIIGKPNVGKSSLLNSLLKEDKAIVTDIAGTTRDIVEGRVDIGGVVLNLIDTAGIRETDDVVEKIGVEKALKVLDKASLVILVLDNARKINDVDKELLRISANKNRIIVINKNDLNRELKTDELNTYITVDEKNACVFMSSFSDNDIEKLEKLIKIKCKISDINNIDATYIGNARQIAKLKEAKNNLLQGIEAINLKMPIDMVGINIKEAWMNLGEILGEENQDSMIDELFSRFCLGK